MIHKQIFLGLVYLFNCLAAIMRVNITTEEYDLMGLIDRDILNLLYKQGFITYIQIQEIVTNSELDLEEDSIASYTEICISELQRRFLENVECALFSPSSDNAHFIISNDAKWVLDQIMEEEYDETGELVAKVLPNFDLKEID